MSDQFNIKREDAYRLAELRRFSAVIVGSSALLAIALAKSDAVQFARAIAASASRRIGSVGNVHMQIQCVAKTNKALLFCKKEAKNFCLLRHDLPQLPTQRAKVFWFFFSKRNAFSFVAKHERDKGNEFSRTATELALKT